MEKELAGIEGAVVYYDDVCVFGVKQESHDKALIKVLEKLKECGLTVKKEKCQINKTSVSFLGYLIDKDGLHAAPEKVKAILQMKRPENITELRSFLGLVNYYSQFIKNFADIVNPLHVLLRKDITWSWNKECERAFNKCKNALASKEVLTHYQPDVQVKITCDASPVGVAAVLSHIFDDNSERPIAFASRTLSRAERNYAQLDREAIALVFGVKSFHQYVYGREFELETDHKPLTFIFGPKKGLPVMSAARVQRWAVFLTAYNFKIKHIKGKSNIVADTLSRNLITDFKNDGDNFETDFCTPLNFISETVNCISIDEIRDETSKDVVLKMVCAYVKYGWPNIIDDNLNIFKQKQNEIYIENGCLMWGHRVIIPMKLRKRVLTELHSRAT